MAAAATVAIAAAAAVLIGAAMVEVVRMTTSVTDGGTVTEIVAATAIIAAGVALEISSSIQLVQLLATSSSGFHVFECLCRGEHYAGWSWLQRCLCSQRRPTQIVLSQLSVADDNKDTYKGLLRLHTTFDCQTPHCG